MQLSVFFVLEVSDLDTVLQMGPQEGRLRLDVRGKLLREREWGGAEQLPREAVDAPSIPGGVQGQVGWGPGQPGLVWNVEVGGPACGRGIGT